MKKKEKTGSTNQKQPCTQTKKEDLPSGITIDKTGFTFNIFDILTEEQKKKIKVKN